MLLCQSVIDEYIDIQPMKSQNRMKKGERWSHDTHPRSHVVLKYTYHIALNRRPLPLGMDSWRRLPLGSGHVFATMCYASFTPSKLVGFHDVLSGMSSINPRFLRKLAYRSVWCINLFNLMPFAYLFGQIIATAHDLTPKVGSQSNQGKSPYFREI